MGFGNTTVEGMGMTPEFWKGKKVFLTGHTGFKGSWLSLWLQGLGADVTGYSLDMPSEPCLFKLAGVSTGMHSITGDIRDLGYLLSCIQKHSPDIVIHLAAQSLVRRSYSDPTGTYTTNILGTVNILEALRKAGSTRAAVIVTSDKCYENKEWLWGYRENEPMGGYDPYSSSKACAELVTSAYRNSFFNPSEFDQHGLAIASVRAGNVIGGGDWAEDRIIPDIINAFNESRPVTIRNPNAIRPWQFVLEPLNGYLTLIEHMWENGPTYSEAWNFAPDDCDIQRVAWIVEQLGTLWGHGACWNQKSAKQPHEAKLLKLDSTKARMRLSWAPIQPLSTTLEWILEWYRAYFCQEDIRYLTLNQINRYQEKLLS